MSAAIRQTVTTMSDPIATISDLLAPVFADGGTPKRFTVVTAFPGGNLGAHVLTGLAAEFLAELVVAAETGAKDQLGDGLAAGAAHRALLIVYADREVNAVRDGFAAVKAVFVRALHRPGPARFPVSPRQRPALAAPSGPI